MSGITSDQLSDRLSLALQALERVAEIVQDALDEVAREAGEQQHGKQAN